MDYQKQYNDIFLDLHSTNFVDGESKVNQFIKNNPGILSDFEFDRKVSLLKAQSFEYANKLEDALEAYLELWHKHFSVESVNYLLVGLTIAELFLKLNKKEAALNFAQTVFNEISLHGFENHDLILTINIFRMLPDFEATALKEQQFLNYLTEKLGINSKDIMERSKLEELENKLRNEGQQLTKILATANASTPEITRQELEQFLARAINPVFRLQASYSYENLRKN
jgi:hypothetical protein